MASLTLYGSNIADATLTTACDMAAASGGTETHVTTTVGATSGGSFTELWSQTGTTGGSAAAIAAPTGHGWVYTPGAGTFAAANWSAAVALDTTNAIGNSDTLTIRFYKYSGGIYTSIGSIAQVFTSSGTRAVVTLSATAMPSTTFTSTDLLYVDLWVEDDTGPNTEIWDIYGSTSASAGVANDMQVTTSNFTPATVTLYGSSVADGTLTTAAKMAEYTTGGTETSKFTPLVASGAGYLEIWSLGKVSTAPPLNASLPAQTGQGWIDQATTLEGKTIAAGTWTINMAYSTDGAANDAFTFVVRVAVRSSGGVYTTIGSLSQAGITPLATRTAVTFSGVLPSASFAVGDRLYLDTFIWRSDWSTIISSTVANVFESNSGTAGVANDTQITTPIFSPTASGNFPTFITRGFMSTLLQPTAPPYVTRGMLSTIITPMRNVTAHMGIINAYSSFVTRGFMSTIPLVTQSAMGRMHVLDPLSQTYITRGFLSTISYPARNAVGRIKISASTTTKNAIGRVRAVNQSTKNLVGRMRYASQSTRNLVGRLRNVNQASSNATSRLRNVTLSTKNSVGSLRNTNQTTQNTTARTRYVDVAGFYITRAIFSTIRAPGINFAGRLAYVDVAGTYVTRAILSTIRVPGRNVAGRLQLVSSANTTTSNALARTRLAVLATKNLTSRTRIAITATKNSVGRERLVTLSTKNLVGRLRNVSQSTKNLTARERIAVTSIRNSVGRTILRGQSTINLVARARIATTATKNAVGRLRSVTQTVKNLPGRIKIFSNTTTYNATARFVFLTTAPQYVTRGFMSTIVMPYRSMTGRVGIATTTQQYVTRAFLSTLILPINRMVGRTRIVSQTSSNLTGRMRYVDIAGFYVTRAILSTIRVPGLNIAGRMRSVTQTLKNSAARLRISVLTTKNLTARTRLAITSIRNTTAHLKAVSQTTRNISARERLTSTSHYDSRGRFRFSSIILRNITSRLRFASQRQWNGTARLKYATAGTLIVRNLKGRFPVVAKGAKNSSGRLSVLVGAVPQPFTIPTNTITQGIARNSIEWDIPEQTISWIL